MKKIILFAIIFFIVFFVSAKKIATFDNIYKPYQFQIYGNDLYVVDGYVIKLFSMKSFKLITQFGKKGEGPGELKYPPRIMIYPDSIFAADRSKVLFFSRRGKLIKEKKLPNRILVDRINQGYLGRKFVFDRKKFSVSIHIKIFDEDFKKKKDIFNYTPEGLFIMISGMTKIQDRNMVPHYTRAITDGNRIYLADTKRGFYIEIYDSKGNKIKTINNDYKKRRVSESFKKKVMDKLKNVESWERDKKMFNFIFPEYFPAFKLLKVDNEKIYIFTHLIKEEMRELIILDLKGNILKKTLIPDKKYFNICNNKFYYFVDNEDEEVMEFYVIDL